MPCTISLQAAAGSTGSNGLRDLAKTGSEDFWGTSSRLDRASTRQRNRDLLLQDSQVIYHRTGVRTSCLSLGTALKTSWCRCLRLWGGFTSWGWWLNSVVQTGLTVMSGNNLMNSTTIWWTRLEFDCDSAITCSVNFYLTGTATRTTPGTQWENCTTTGSGYIWKPLESPRIFKMCA